MATDENKYETKELLAAECQLAVSTKDRETLKSGITRNAGHRSRGQ